MFRILDFLVWSLFFAVLLPSTVSHLAAYAPYLVDPYAVRTVEHQLQAEAEDFAYRRMLRMLQDLGEKCQQVESQHLVVTVP